MAKARFREILNNIPFSDVEKDQSDRKNKLNDLYSISNLLFKKFFFPGRNITLDESICPFKVNLSIKVFIPSKRTRYGIKSYRLYFNEGCVFDR